MNSTIIIRECKEFLKASNGNPLIRFLPQPGTEYRKVKVRKRSRKSSVDDLFNTVFSEHPDLRQRCIFANGEKGEPAVKTYANSGTEAFYVFPIDGFRFMYSPRVTHSETEYAKLYEEVATMHDNPTDLLAEMLKFDYTSDDLETAINNGCEIIIYGIPYFYAVKKSSILSYSTLFSL